MLHQEMVKLVADKVLQHENAVLKLSTNSLQDRLRKVAVECLDDILDILLLQVGVCIIELDMSLDFKKLAFEIMQHG